MLTRLLQERFVAGSPVLVAFVVAFVAVFVVASAFVAVSAVLVAAAAAVVVVVVAAAEVPVVVERVAVVVVAVDVDVGELTSCHCNSTCIEVAFVCGKLHCCSRLGLAQIQRQRRQHYFLSRFYSTV